MELSASALNSFTKCGYKHFLTKVKGLAEPGKKGYNMLLGDIVGDAIQACAVHLNKHKSLSDEDIAEHLYKAYETRFTNAGIPDSILAPIREVLTEGESEAVMQLLDSLSVCINMSQYEFTPPPPLKSGKISMNKKKPPFCMKVVNSLEAVTWFFEEKHPHYAIIRDALIVEPEKYFQYDVAQRINTINGVEVPETDLVRGYFDLRVEMLDGRKFIYELKFTNTAYTQDIVNKLNQVLTYYLAEPEAEVTLFDITERRYYTAQPQGNMLDLLRVRYKNMSHMVRNQIYMPACGTDPYSDKKMLCGFKCSGCEYGANTPMEDDLDA